jgi:hypothetical protein
MRLPKKYWNKFLIVKLFINKNRDVSKPTTNQYE